MSAPTDELKEKIRQLESDEAFLELSKKYNEIIIHHGAGFSPKK